MIARNAAPGAAHASSASDCPAEVVRDPACDHDAGKEEPPGFLAGEGDRRDVVVATQGSRSDLFLRQNRRTITMKVTVIVAETAAAISIPAFTAGFITRIPPDVVWPSHLEELLESGRLVVGMRRTPTGSPMPTWHPPALPSHPGMPFVCAAHGVRGWQAARSGVVQLGASAGEYYLVRSDIGARLRGFRTAGRARYRRRQPALNSLRNCAAMAGRGSRGRRHGQHCQPNRSAMAWGGAVAYVNVAPQLIEPL